MIRTAVLLDHEHASFYSPDGTKPHDHIQVERQDHHTHKRTHDQHEQDKFFGQVADKLKDSKEVLVLGHHLPVTHFKNYLEKHRPAVAKVVVGYETVDRPTDAEVITAANTAFRKAERMKDLY